MTRPVEHNGSRTGELRWAQLALAFSVLTGNAVAKGQAPEPVPAAAAAPASPANADPAPDVQAQYRDMVARAVSEFDAGRWAEARALFLQAHALWPSARTFRTLGMTSFELRAYARALQELQAALDDPRRPLPEDQRQQVAQLIEQTRAFVGRFHLKLVPQNTTLQVDGAPYEVGQDGLLLLEIGRHELTARAPGYSPSQRRLDVQGREDQQLAFELLPEAAPAAQLSPAAPVAAAPASPAASAEPQHRARVWTWVAGGTAVALGGATAVLWAVSKSNFNSAKSACDKRATTTDPCKPDNTDTSGITTPSHAGNITLGIGIAAAVGAVALFFIEGGSEESAHVTAGPGGVELRGRF